MSSLTPRFKSTESLTVTANGIRVGELSRTEGKGIYFAYDKEWLAKGFNLSPLTMKFDDKPQLAQERRLFKGLHGPFADSLPDGWGLLLMDRFFDATFGVGASLTLSPLDRLAYMGDRGMGVFEYHPKTEKVSVFRSWQTDEEGHPGSVQRLQIPQAGWVHRSDACGTG